MTEFHNLQVRRAFLPVVPPADNDVATVWRVTVIPEITAPVLELNPDTLPLSCINLSLGFAIWVSRLHGFHEIPKFTGHHPKEEHNSFLVDRFMP